MTPKVDVHLLRDLFFYLLLLLSLPAHSSPSDTPTQFTQKTTKRFTPIYRHGQHHLETLSWVVKLPIPGHYDTIEDASLNTIADQIAKHAELNVQGVIGELKGHYLMSHKLHDVHYSASYLLTSNHSGHAQSGYNRNRLPAPWSVKHLEYNQWIQHLSETERLLDSHPLVEWYMQQVVHYREKRSVLFDDPSYHKQWHLHNINHVDEEQDIHVVKVWEKNITGRGITVAVIDDGLEWNNPDLEANYDPEGSYDLNENDRDPMPSTKNKKNHHGTRCAGEIAAAANNVCGVGVAYEAGISGIKVLDGPMTDSLEAAAFTKALKAVDVYSCSWGPDDDAKTVDGPHYLAVKALQYAVEYGRSGYGSIFVVASGNGGLVGDNCNFDGYANSIYTVTIGAVDELGEMPYYAEECASMLAVTYSSGQGRLRSIVTTDWLQDGGHGCTEGHTGTSAAAPLAAGMIALMLQARSCLTWRDVQHIIVMAAVRVDIDVAHWTKNKAGLHHSPKHGFGLMHAWRLVNAAKAWNPVPFMTFYGTEQIKEHQSIPPKGKKLVLRYLVTDEMLDGHSLYTMEYVHLTLTLTHQSRGDLEILLKCPSGTPSVLAATREKDKSDEGFNQWTFSTVRCWGETPGGVWELSIQDKGHKVSKSRGSLDKWQLQLYGSPMSMTEVQQRKRLVEEASDGRYLNFTRPCPAPPLRNHPSTPLSQKTLKILLLLSGFCLVMGVYQTLEYMICYSDEKKKFYDELRAAAEERSSRRCRDGDREGREDLRQEGHLLCSNSVINHDPLDNSTAVTESLADSSTDCTGLVEASPLPRRAMREQSTGSKVFQTLRSVLSPPRSYKYKVLPQDVVSEENHAGRWRELESRDVSG